MGLETKRYFDWLLRYIDCRDCDDRTMLLEQLFHTEFTWKIYLDNNRAHDGLALRDIYEHDTGRSTGIPINKCSVLEMLIGLARRCEDYLMYDPKEGDQTYIWFWTMINNLGLYSQRDSQFDADIVNDILYKFLNREYDSYGHGNVFTIHDDKEDMRAADIWLQANWYFQEHFNFKIW